MLTNDMLAMMAVRSVIFHDVPNQRGDGGPTVVLATEVTQIDGRRRKLLQDKLKRVLASRYSFGIMFAAETTSLFRTQFANSPPQVMGPPHLWICPKGLLVISIRFNTGRSRPDSFVLSILWPVAIAGLCS